MQVLGMRKVDIDLIIDVQHFVKLKSVSYYEKCNKGYLEVY